MTTEDRAPRAQSVLPAMPWMLIVAAGFATFAITGSGVTRSPFLIDMSRDLNVSLAAIANLIGLSSFAWGATSFIAGMGSDRIGRRPFLIGAPAALALTLVGVSLGQSFWSVGIWVTLAGGCSGLFTGVSLAEVAGRVSDSQRARAIGWVMAGQSLTLLIGVPVAAWVGADLGWRGVNFCVAGLVVLAVIAMIATTRQVGKPGQTAPAGTDLPPPLLRTAFTGPVMRLLGSVIAERVCFALAGVYYATFLLQSYALPLMALALPMAVFAMGNILGTLAGAQVGDRVRNRRLTFALALLAAGAVALPLFGWRPGLPVTMALGFAYMFCTAFSRPSLMAALANVPAEVRGTVMGLNSTAASAAWLAAASLGGWILSTVGFTGFGPFVAVLAVFGAVLALTGRAP